MRRKDIEDELERRGFEFEFIKDYQLDRADWNEADANEARMGAALDVNTVVQYAMDMEEGADWAPITVLERPGKLDQVINGRHTYAARGMCKPPGLTNDAIRIKGEADPYRIELAIAASNKNNGRQLTHDEKLLHAADLKKRYPHATLKDLAMWLKAKPGTISEYLKAVGAERRADRMQRGSILRRGRHFSMDLKRALDTLQSDTVFGAAIDLIDAHPLDLRGQAGLDLVASLRSAGSDTKAVKLIDAREVELNKAQADRDRKKSRSPTAPMTRFMGKTSVRGVLKAYPGSVDKLYMEALTCPELKRERKVLDDAIDVLIEARARMTGLIEDHERAAEEAASRRDGKPGSEGISPAP
jgi:hypothetical protein